MSGTSLDGVDAALLDTDGEDVVRPGPSLTVPYDAAIRAQLRDALETALGMAQGAPVPQSIWDAERVLTEAHAQAVKALLEKSGLAAGDIDLIGFHGQTILHRPEQGWTWQIGDGALLAKLTGIDVVNDFRSADVAAGGQGAPLMPLYHAVMSRAAGLAEPVVVVNIGGVAQVTYIKDDYVSAFDTGPGNALIDDWVFDHTGLPIDVNGALARSGKIDLGLLSRLAEDDFFDRVPPKSLDRMEFDFIPKMMRSERLSFFDGAATLTDFTALAIAKAQNHFPSKAETWVISGGGRHNGFLMERLKERTKAYMLDAEDVAWDGDGFEAHGFAYLAVRSRKGLPLSLPTTTGVKAPMTGGRIWKASCPG